MNYLDELYEAWLSRSKDTPEADAVMKKFCTNNEENYDIIVSCIDAVSRQSFEAGFSIAMQLTKL